MIADPFELQRLRRRPRFSRDSGTARSLKRFDAAPRASRFLRGFDRTGPHRAVGRDINNGCARVRSARLRTRPRRFARAPWLEERRGDAVGSVQVDNTEVVSHVLASGGGVSVIPCAVAEERPGMVRVFPDPVAFNTG